MGIWNMGVGTSGMPGRDGKDGVDGTNGKDGKDGKDGLSPIVQFERHDSSVTVKVTDAEGVKAAIIYDGEKGEKGDKGEPGTPGADGKNGADGVPGKDNLPNAVSVTGAAVTLTMDHNVEYHCANEVTALTINDFNAATDGKVSVWAIQFKAGSGITVKVPETVRFCVAEPVFTEGVTYWLTFVPLITGEVLGVWVSNE